MSITGGIMAAGAIGGGLISGHSASHAADTQSAAAQQAAQLQHEDAQAALDWQKQMFGFQTNLAMPWINSGRNSLNTLNSLMGLPSASPGMSPGSTNPFSSFGPGSSTLGFGGPMSNPDAGTFGTGPQFNRLSMARRMFNPMDDGSGASIGNAGPGEMGGRGIGAVDQQGAGLPANGGMLPNPDIGNFAPANGSPAVAAVPGSTPQAGDPNAYLQPFTNWNEKFQAPTDITMQNDPGYLARLKMGQQAIENSAAAKGTLLTGGTAKDLTQFGQDYGSNEFSNIYNRALTEYQQRYNIFQNQQATQFNRLAALAGYGQTGVGQLNSAGTSAANNAGNILLTSGGQIGQNINNAAAARASGYVGSGNAYAGMFNNLSQLAMLYGLQNQGGGGFDMTGIPK